MMGRLFIILLLTLSTYQTSAQHVHYHAINNDYMTKFERYDKKSGLSDNFCTKIYQDKYGFLWIGTANGLNRFDGHEFIHYLNIEGDTTSLTGNFISDITEDQYGNLWIATHTGLNQYDRTKNQFIRWIKAESQQSIRDNHIRAILVDSNYLWIETLDGTLSKLNLTNKKFSHYKHTSITQPYYNYHALYQDSIGNIWLGGRNLGPIRFNPVTETFTYIENGDINKGKKRDLDVACFFTDSQNTFWISGIDGIYTYDKKTNLFHRFLAKSTYSIIQDKQEDVWFGTGGGVYRYNYKKKILLHYANDENNIHSLSNNDVNQIFEDKDGNIWIATEKGLNKTSLQKNNFGHFYHIPENHRSLSSNYVTTLTTDTEDNLWIGYEDKGFDYYNLTTGQIKSFQQKDYPQLKSNRVSTLYFDKNNQLWIGLWQGVGFCTYNPAKDEFLHYAYDPDTRKKDWYSDFAEDTNNNFWVGLWGSRGLHLFNRKTGEFEPDHFMPLNAPGNNQITALSSDTANIWLGSNNGFIYRYHLNTGRFFAYKNIKGEYSEFDKIHFQNIFNFKNVEKIITDRLNQKWVVTDKGIISIRGEKNIFFSFPSKNRQSMEFINYCPNQSQVWLRIDHKLYAFNFIDQKYQQVTLPDFTPERIKFIDSRDNYHYIIFNNHILQWFPKQNKIDTVKFFDNIILKIFSDNTSRLWLFTENDVIILDKTLNDVSQNFISHALKNEDINNLYQLKNYILIATNNGLYKINQAQKTIQNIYSHTNNTHNINSKIVKAITSDNDYNIWIGTTKGLYKYNTKQNTLQAFNQPSDNAITSHLVTQLLEDTQGYIWVGTTNGGLNRINPQTRKVFHFVNHPEDSTSISSNQIQCIFQDHKNRIWVGTENGLNLFLQNSKKFKHFYKKDGLPNNRIRAMIEDNNNNLWIATENGLCKFNPDNKIAKNYYKEDGLQSNKYTNAAAKLKTGHLVFGGENGINIFKPEEIEIKYNHKEVQITNFKIFNDVYKTDFTNTKYISLNYDENFFTISFSALNFYNSKHFSYKYKLNGVDPEWVITRNLNAATYTDISPGNYTFQVMAIAPDGTKSKIQSLKIDIIPPYWQTWWFLSIIGIILFTIAGWVLHLRFKKYKAEKENIQLEQKLLRSQMNPHFIFNALFSIQNFLYAQKNTEADHYLTKFSRLLRLTLENSRETFITVENEMQTIRNYLDLQKLRFDDKFNYTIYVAPNINKEKVLIPPMLAQPFIENAIEHGFYEKGKNYELTISITLEDKNIIYTIEDNGIGIEQSKKMNSTYKKGHKSLGMQITNERLQNLKKITKQNIKIQVIDLKREGTSGTKIIFTIPVK